MESVFSSLLCLLPVTSGEEQDCCHSRGLKITSGMLLPLSRLTCLCSAHLFDWEKSAASTTSRRASTNRNIQVSFAGKQTPTLQDFLPHRHTLRFVTFPSAPPLPSPPSSNFFSPPISLSSHLDLAPFQQASLAGMSHEKAHSSRTVTVILEILS